MKNEFDNNLTDKGWQSMRPLLDREMPEQRRRRRFAWWLFALLLLAGLGGWWLLEDSKPVDGTPSPVEAPKTLKPIVEAETAPRLGENDEITSTIRNEAALPSPRHHAASTPKVYSGRKVEPLQKSQDLALKAFGEKLPNLPNPENLEINSTTSQFPEKERQVVASNLVLLTPTETNEETQSDFTQNAFKIEPLATLPPKSGTAAKVTWVEGCLVGGTPTKKSKNTSWSFGLTAGLASENFSAINGFSAGGAVDWQLSRRWGLRSGLQYARYSLSAAERPVISLDSYVYTDATGNDVINLGGGSNPNTSVSVPVYVPVERLQQLEMPVLAYWQPLRSLRIFGGASFAYNISAQASERNYSSNQYYYAQTQEAKNNLNELAASNLPRWRTALQTGIGLRFGRHFELGAFYKHGISSGKNSADNAQDNFNPNLPADLKRSAGASHYFLLNGIWFF